MHSSFSPSAPYQYTMHNSNPSAHQTKMSQSSPSAPPQAPIGSSNPVQASRSSFFQAYANQSNSNPIAPPNLGSSPTPRPRRKRMVTSETPNASKNASRYMGAIKFARSQSSMHSPKKWIACCFLFFNEWLVFCIIIAKPVTVVVKQCLAI